jgi:hypothetical protein
MHTPGPAQLPPTMEGLLNPRVPGLTPYRIVLSDVREKLANTRRAMEELLKGGRVPEGLDYFFRTEDLAKPLMACYRSLVSDVYKHSQYDNVLFAGSVSGFFDIHCVSDTMCSPLPSIFFTRFPLCYFFFLFCEHSATAGLRSSRRAGWRTCCGACTASA